MHNTKCMWGNGVGVCVAGVGGFTSAGLFQQSPQLPAARPAKRSSGQPLRLPGSDPASDAQGAPHQQRQEEKFKKPFSPQGTYEFCGDYSSPALITNFLYIFTLKYDLTLAGRIRSNTL